VEELPKIAATTDDSGTFTLRGVPPGNRVLFVQCAGYSPATWYITVEKGKFQWRTLIGLCRSTVPENQRQVIDRGF
jgi:hypothetical protein